MRYLFISKKVDTFIETLDKGGKARKTIAAKTRAILADLASGAAPHHDTSVGTFTKYGEKRIRHCKKYDLGRGYRLITLQRDDTLFASFLGTHDNCQRWLAGNSRLSDCSGGAGRTIRVIEHKDADKDSAAAADTVAQSRDHSFEKHYTDKELRTVFAGLVEGLK
jgi:hypothetical protein